MAQVFELPKPSPVIYLSQSGLPRQHHQLETKYASVVQDYLRHLSQTTVMLSTLLLTSYSPRTHFIIFRLPILRLLHVREQKKLENPSSHPSSIDEHADKFPGQGKTSLNSRRERATLPICSVFSRLDETLPTLVTKVGFTQPVSAHSSSL